MPKEPNEESFTLCPRSRLATISRSTSSTISADSLRGNPTFRNTASARSARVNVFPLIVRVLPKVAGQTKMLIEHAQRGQSPAAIKFLILHHFRGRCGFRAALLREIHQRTSTAPQVKPPPMAS